MRVSRPHKASWTPYLQQPAVNYSSRQRIACSRGLTWTSQALCCIMPFNQDQATTFLQSRVDLILLEDDSVAKICEALDYLPLALTQVATNMNDYRVRSDRLLEIYKREAKSLISGQLPLLRQHPGLADRDELLPILFISLTELFRSDPLASMPLATASMFSSKAIPENLIKAYPGYSAQQYTKALGTL